MKAELLEVLKQIKKRPTPGFGICHQLVLRRSDENADYWFSKLQGLFRRWPQFSGSAYFPVPHPTKNPEDAYIAYGSTQNMWDRRAQNMWDRRTKYGRARWDLLEFCISELEKELSNEQY